MPIGYIGVGHAQHLSEAHSDSVASLLKAKFLEVDVFPTVRTREDADATKKKHNLLKQARIFLVSPFHHLAAVLRFHSWTAIVYILSWLLKIITLIPTGGTYRNSDEAERRILSSSRG